MRGRTLTVRTTSHARGTNMITLACLMFFAPVGGLVALLVYVEHSERKAKARRAEFMDEWQRCAARIIDGIR